ncbi:Hypothetical predicted protein [Cloeon dipterum]|uniref:Uncharacterized protein n=1 Tax=Cloeon dipterum TaxID=197152 RepID=A0A8S1CBE0_9INSE|nr:Hypothetical predicted protein [Cloeon dipterum]
MWLSRQKQKHFWFITKIRLRVWLESPSGARTLDPTPARCPPLGRPVYDCLSSKSTAASLPGEASKSR